MDFQIRNPHSAIRISSISQFFTNDNDEDIRDQRFPFMNDEDAADSTWGIAVHTPSKFCTGEVQIEPPRIDGRCHILYPSDCFLNITDNFIIARHKDNLPRTKT